jgi:hypothetical protein
LAKAACLTNELVHVLHDTSRLEKAPPANPGA